MSKFACCAGVVLSAVVARSGAISGPPAMAERVQAYATVRLSADLAALTPTERQMIPLLIEAARQMDAIFWLQAYGDRDALLKTVRDPHTRRFCEINYGPWDRLGDNAPFVAGVGPKRPGANFYPPDMTREEFETHLAKYPSDRAAFTSQYTVIVRKPGGTLSATPYNAFYGALTRRAISKLKAAGSLTENKALKVYLFTRATALATDQYRESDRVWLDMKDNTLDIVIGPIETYEDQLFGYKAAHEAYVLVKDKTWSARLARYAAMLPDLQRHLPCAQEYKNEMPGTDSDLGAYDVIFYAGDCNAGAKTIAVNLPNDEQVQLEKGTRRLQLKNAMKAKFDRIVVPLAKVLIDEDQRRHVTFDAFFSNTMFHEVAHGLGIKNTINGRGTVRQALKEQASALEEGKADILGLYMVTRLYEQGELKEGTVMDNYVTFLASIFRSIRFGASSAHGRANMMRFNFFKEHGAFTRSPSGSYRVNFDKMKQAMEALSTRIIQLQGDGDYDGTVEMMTRLGLIGPVLQGDLERLRGARIPVDIVFEQGVDVLGL